MSPKLIGKAVTLGQIYSTDYIEQADNETEVNSIVLNASCDVISVPVDEKQMNQYPLFTKSLTNKGVNNNKETNENVHNVSVKSKMFDKNQGCSGLSKYCTTFEEVPRKTTETNIEDRKYVLPLKFSQKNTSKRFRSRDSPEPFRAFNKNRDTPEPEQIENSSVLKSFNIFSRNPSPFEDTLKSFSKKLNSPKSFTTSKTPNTDIQETIEPQTSSPKNKKPMLDEMDRTFSLEDDENLEYSPTKSITSLLSLNSESYDYDDNACLNVSLTKSIGSEISVDYTPERSFLTPKKDCEDMPSIQSADLQFKKEDQKTHNMESTSTSVDDINKDIEDFTIKPNLVEARKKKLSCSVDNLLEATTNSSSTRFVNRNSLNSIKDDPNWNKFLNKLDEIIVHKSSTAKL